MKIECRRGWAATFEDVGVQMNKERAEEFAFVGGNLDKGNRGGIQRHAISPRPLSMRAMDSHLLPLDMCPLHYLQPLLLCINLVCW